jgi:hypothetical protein
MRLPLPGWTFATTFPLSETGYDFSVRCMSRIP